VESRGICVEACQTDRTGKQIRIRDPHVGVKKEEASKVRLGTGFSCSLARWQVEIGHKVFSQLKSG
jgi:hypothetical protein